MRKTTAISTGMLMLVATACGQRTEDRAETAATGAAAAGFLGPITYRYDPVLLKSANVQIPIPPDGEEEAYAIKLVPARTIEGSPELCPAGTQTCPVEWQPGVTMALLEKPFALYEEALRSSTQAQEIVPSTVDGVQGIALEPGNENGLEVEYRLVPVKDRALLIKIQRDGQSAQEQEALEEAVESLVIGD